MNNPGSMILIELTSKCNLNCDFCARSKITIGQAQMQLDTLKNIAEKIKDFSTICFCGMGEPFLYHKLQDALSIFKEKNIILVSNGTVPIDMELLRANNNITTITFSVEGPSEEASKGNCRQYNFEKLLSNMKKVRLCGKAIGINFLLNEKNISYALDMIDFCKEQYVSELNVLLPLYEKQWIKNNKAKLREVLAAMKLQGNENGISVVIPTRNLSCRFHQEQVPVISTEGKIKPCCDYFFIIPQSVNLTECSYEEVRQSNSFINFERGIYCEECQKRTISIEN